MRGGVSSVNGDTGDVVVGFTDFSASLVARQDSVGYYCEFQQGAVKGLRIGDQCIIQGRVKCIDFHWVAGSGFIGGAPRADATTTGRWWLGTMEDGGVVTINGTGSTLYFTRTGTSGVTAGTPNYSGGRIGCWLYADYDRTASVTFSYKVGETVTEKFFMVKYNGELVKGIKFNGVLLDPNQGANVLNNTKILHTGVGT